MFLRKRQQLFDFFCNCAIQKNVHFSAWSTDLQRFISFRSEIKKVIMFAKAVRPGTAMPGRELNQIRYTLK